MRRGFGWLAFAGYVLIIAGVFSMIDGIVALANSSFFTANAHFVFSSLRTWGWIILALGILETLPASASSPGASGRAGSASASPA